MRIKDDSFVGPRSRRRRLIKQARRAKDAALRTRHLIALHTAEGKNQRQIAAMLGTNVSVNPASPDPTPTHTQNQIT